MVIYYAFAYLSVDSWLTVSDNENKNNYKVIFVENQYKVPVLNEKDLITF